MLFINILCSLLSKLNVSYLYNSLYSLTFLMPALSRFIINLSKVLFVENTILFELVIIFSLPFQLAPASLSGNGCSNATILYWKAVFPYFFLCIGLTLISIGLSNKYVYMKEDMVKSNFISGVLVIIFSLLKIFGVI